MPDPFTDGLLESHRKLWGYALRLTRNRADAEDLTQDTLVRALHYRERFELGTNMNAWLYSIARNLHLSGVRHSKSICMVELHESRPDDCSTEDQAIARMSIKKALCGADPVLAMAAAGFPRREIATQLGTTLDAIEARVHRARVL